MSRPIYIALGANLGEPKESFKRALRTLEQSGAILRQLSGIWQSPSWPPGKGHPDYNNACAEIDYAGKANDLLALLHNVEADLGRVRNELNAPRTLDLDLLDFRGEHVNQSSLTLPHPRMLSRGFVLLPLSQIAPDWQHPVTGEGIESALAKLPLSDIEPMRYIGHMNWI